MLSCAAVGWPAVRIGRLRIALTDLEKALTAERQATTYLKALTTIMNSDPKLWRDSTKVMRQAGNGFSVAAKINNSYLPALEQMQAALASMDPPPAFRVAHAHIRQFCATMNETLYSRWPPCKTRSSPRRCRPRNGPGATLDGLPLTKEIRDPLAPSERRPGAPASGAAGAQKSLS